MNPVGGGSWNSELWRWSKYLLNDVFQSDNMSICEMITIELKTDLLQEPSK